MSDNSPATALFTMVGGDDDSGEVAEKQEQPPPTQWEEESSYFRRWEEEKSNPQRNNDLHTLELCLLDSTPEEAAAHLDQIIASARPEDVQAKCELVDFLPDLAGQLANCSDEWSRRLKPLVNSHFLRIVEFALLYPNAQVVKTGHVALLRLLGHGLIQYELLETRIWPILMEKIDQMQDTDALVVDTIHLMNKLMEWLGDDQTERIVVPSLDHLSVSTNVAVRRVLAQLYGDFCAVVSITCSEKLVPPFLRLCEDVDLVVRKTCAEVFMSVSSTVSLETRKTDLAPAFENLLVDTVRWVSMAAYQSLGPFITTFAEPSITSLGYNHFGELVLKHPDGFESKGKSRTGEGDLLEELFEDNDSRFRRTMTVGRRQPDWLTSFQDRNAEMLQMVPDKYPNSDVRASRKSTMRDWAKWKRQHELIFTSDCKPVKNSEYEGEEDEETMEGEAILVLGEGEEVAEEEEIEAEDEGEEANEAGSGAGDAGGSNESEEPDEDLVIDHVEEIVCTNWSDIVRSSVTIDPKDENFNTFQFWREPLPNIDTELNGQATPQSEHLESSKPHVANESYLNNNPVEIFSLRPAKILRPPAVQNRGPVDKAQEYLFRDPVVEEKPNLIVEPKRREKLKKAPYSKFDKKMLAKEAASHLLPSSSTDENLLNSSSISSSNQDLQANMDGSLALSHSKGGSEPDEEIDDQDIVPGELVSQFVSMAKLATSQHDVDNDLAHHCAYNLPAVVLTLGPEHWGLLRPAYKALAEAVDWKVRRTAASSIHELAVILGEEVATQDLVPVFHGFIKDLDEVRVAALKHLAAFLKLLRPAGRETFLPLLTEFLMMDNQWKWRFRYKLAEQLLQVLGLFSPADTCHHLSPIVMTLLLDRVSDVRKIALQLVTELVSHVSIDIPLLRSLLTQLAEQFAHSSRWNRRQTFSLFCSRLVSESVLSGDMFSRDVLPHLLDLSWDPVPNVRLTVARALANDIMAQPFFTDISSPHYEVLIGVLKRLQTDKDQDVRFYASQVPQNLQLHINESNLKIMSSSVCEEETKNL